MGDVKEAKQAWLAEKDPVNKEGLWLMWNKAEERLDSFRRQQVAGGEIPSRLPTLCELDKALDVSLQMRLACAWSIWWPVSSGRGQRTALPAGPGSFMNPPLTIREH